jgi:mono/diheme cytochrome c family protein
MNREIKLIANGLLAVSEGQDPDGTQLNTDMPRWNIGDDDLADLIAYLKTLH